MPVESVTTPSPRARRLFPILDWGRRYDRRWLRGDLIAGVAVAAMIVPKNLGYAGIAGIPVENGLYAAAAAAIIYGIFCTSRHISTGPSSSLAAVAGGAVLVTGLGSIEAAQLVAAIAIATGALFLLVAILRLGWIASFLSRAVVTGFLAGAAIDVVIGELPKLTGTSADGVNAWQELASWVRGLGGLSPATLLVGLTALAVIFGLRFALPRMPGALVLVVGGLLGSVLFDLGARGVALVGPVPRGLPLPQVPSLDVVSQDLPAIAIAAFALLLIGFSQTAGDAQAFATKHRYRIDLNQESVAQGMANLGAGMFQGMPVSTSLSASSLNESAGARTPVASLATGGIVLATLVLLAPLFSELPKAVLAAVIIDAVVFGMIDVAEFRRLRRVKRFDFWIAVAAVLGVLSVGVLLGVVVGVALSLLWLIHVSTRPSMPLLGRQSGTQVFRDLEEYPEDETDPGVSAIRIDGGLFFATAAALDERVRAVLDGQPGLFALVLDLEGVNFVDAQGAAKLSELDELTEASGVELRLARVKADVSDILAAEGLVERIGRDRIHGNVHRAVEAALAAHARGRSDAERSRAP
jgi:high affinity sulfate transporter 1